MSLRLTGGTANGREIRTRKGLDTRPTASKARAALFAILRDVVEDKRWLDLFGGNGTMGLEALSRGAAWVTFVEKDREACGIITENLARLGFAERATVRCMDVTRWLKGAPDEPYDVIFADPPWAAEVYDRLLTDLIGGGWVRADGLIVAEHRKRTPIPPSVGEWACYRTALYGDTGFSFYRVAVTAE